ncbi:MAG: class A beta-lactamase-related serine hydrolase [Chitinophagaceae bacterium]|nr:class A beta-lactamase-related serine hydrolase [Chitinophagaceae bacterium]
MQLFYACRPAKPTVSKENLLEQLMSQNPAFAEVLKNRDSMRVQIVYTQINRNRNNQPSFTDYYFNVKKDLYFYPASTAKMPVAFLALEKLNNLGIDKNTTFITEKSYAGQTAVYNDPATPDGRPTLSHYIKKLFLVSDNDANNRLYEFLGQQYLNEHLAKKGYKEAQIVHRLAVSLPEDQHRNTNPVSFRDSSGKIIYEQPNISSSYKYIERNDFVGKGYMSGDKLINEPLNFSRKNRIYITDLHQMLRSVIFPEAVPKQQRFNFTESDYRFLYRYMSQLPSETMYPEYDLKEHPDNYGKFFMYGSQKDPKMPKHIRIFNKVGWAYGFLTDVAYIVDFEKNIEFIMSATIYCNADGVLNDDKYDFDTAGLPFLEKLGNMMYEYELKRERKQAPDLSKFKVNYDK